MPSEPLEETLNLARQYVMRSQDHDSWRGKAADACDKHLVSLLDLCSILNMHLQRVQAAALSLELEL